MKKILFFAALVLGLASCSTDPEDLNVVVGGERDVMLNVSLPEATRSASNAGFDFTNFESNNDYDLRYILEIRYNGKVSRTVKTAESTSVSFPVRLAPGREYDFTVWADLVLEGTEDDLCYNTNVDGAGLTNITIKNEKWTANNELRDAYYGKATLTEEQSITNLGTIELTRPFAKIRVISTDIADVRKFDIEPYSVSVKYLKDVYTSFNAVTGVAGTPVANQTVSAEYANAKYDDFDTAEATLFADYIFVPEDGTIQFSMDVKTEGNASIKVTSFTTPIAVGKNKLTTIKGDVLTEGGDVNVDIEDEFGGESGIEDGKTFAKVDTVEEFLDAINKGIEKITLEGDIDLNSLFGISTLSTRAAATLPFVIAEGKTLELDLNGFKITTPLVEDSTTNHFYAFENKGTLTIQDSSEGKTGEIIARGIFNYGTMTLESGKINACDHNGGYGVRNYEGATFVMNGGSIVASNENGDIPGDGYDATTLRIDEGATAEINAGTINNICNYTYAIDNRGTTTIKGGTFTSVHSTIGNYSTMTIDGGSFTCNGLDGVSAHALVTWDGSVTNIYGGTFDGKDNYNGFNVDACAGALVNIYGGKFLPVHSGSLYGEGTIIVTGGEFFDNPSKFVVPGYKAELENGVYVVRKPQALIDFENAIANGNDVTLSDDLTLIDPVAVPEGKEVTINLNGKTLSGVFTKGAGAVITNNATLKVVGGTIKNTFANGDAAINNSGELILEDVKIEGAPLADGGYSAYAVISSGKITINEGTEISADRGCLKLSDNGETIINGGTFVNNDIGSRSLTSHVVDVEDGGSNKLTINGGTFEHRHATTSGGVVICNRTKGTVYVNGGNFSGGNYYGNDNLSDYGYGGTFSVTGGVFSAKPAAKYIAAGYKVIEENGKYNVVLDAVDDVVSSTETLKEAIADGSDTIVLSAGEYDATQITGIAGKTISFVGNGVDTVFDYSSQGYNSYVSGGNGDFTFENMTITRSTETFAGMAHTNSTVYKNCVINGVYFVYEKNAQFIDCTFNVTGNNYNCWLYGTEKVTYTNCTFNCDGKSIYVDGNGDTGSDAEFNNCTFNDINKVVTDKAAVETGTTYGKRYELVFNNAKVNGFNINPNGFVTGTTLWANKHSMPADKLKVTVDGKNAYTIVASDVAGLKAAVAAGAPVVGLKAGVYETKDFSFNGKTLTLVGIEDGAKIFNSQDNAVASGAFDGCKMTFENLTIETRGDIYKGFARMEGVYRNCNFVNNYFTFYGKHEFVGCKFYAPATPKNEHCLWTYGASELYFTECEFNYNDRCINCYSDNDVPGGQTVNFTKCTFITENTASLGAVETNSCFIKDGIVVNLEDCTAPAYGELAWISTWDSTNGANTTINIK